MISVHEAEKLSVERTAAFFLASEEIRFCGENRQHGLCLDGDRAAPTTVRAARPHGAGPAAPPPGEDDRLERLLKKCFCGSFRTRIGLQVLESSVAEMIEITKLVHFSAAS